LANEAIFNSKFEVNKYMFSTQIDFWHKKINETETSTFKTSLEDLADHSNDSIHLYSIKVPKVDQIYNRYVMEGKYQAIEEGYISQQKINSKVLAKFKMCKVDNCTV
jgi:hypothetical protein